MALSPKQKKIAKMAGDPNKIEGEDFKKLRTMKAFEGIEVDADILGNRYDKKLSKYYGSKETELHAGYKGDYKEDSGEDRAEKRAIKEVMQEAGLKFTGAKYGKMIMARGCKMGRKKATKIT